MAANSSQEAPKKLVLKYFEVPGRSEPIRLMLDYGELPHEFVEVAFDKWPEEKPKTKYGQLPILEVDGKPLAQEAAIAKYVARLTGLYPDDPWQGALVDELLELYRETWGLMECTYTITDAAAKLKAREELAAGPLPPILNKLCAQLVVLPTMTIHNSGFQPPYLQKEAGGEFFGGSKPNCVDFIVYSGLSWYSCGFFQGIPDTATLLGQHPALKTHHNRMAALPSVAKRYDSITDGLRLAFKVLP